MIEIEFYDIILINMVTYMTGIFTGLGLCIKYKHKLFRSKSQENLSHLQGLGQGPGQDLGHGQIHNSNLPIAGQCVSHANIGHYPPVMATAPSASVLKEVVIRTTE